MLALLLGLMALTGVRVSNNASNQNERSMLTIKSQNVNADTKKIEALPAKCAALAAISSNNIRIQPFTAAKAQAPTTSCRNSSELNVKQDNAHKLKLKQ